MQLFKDSRVLLLSIVTAVSALVSGEVFIRSQGRQCVRVVSLLPSCTEVLFALGQRPVGVSHGCDRLRS
jgi:ABC-type Fe3+-hydroxamate transport system substrate-binding protein